MMEIQSGIQGRKTLREFYETYLAVGKRYTQEDNTSFSTACQGITLRASEDDILSRLLSVPPFSGVQIGKGISGPNLQKIIRANRIAQMVCVKHHPIFPGRIMGMRSVKDSC